VFKQQLHQVDLGNNWSAVSPQATCLNTQPISTALLTPQYSTLLTPSRSFIHQQEAQAMDLTHPLLAGALQAGVLPQVLAQLTPHQLDLLSQQQPQVRTLVSVNEGAGDAVWTQSRQAVGPSGLGVSMTPRNHVPQHMLLQQHQKQQPQQQQILILQQHPEQQQQWNLGVDIPSTQAVMHAPSLTYHVLQHDQLSGATVMTQNADLMGGSMAAEPYMW
jgi:hypothetical protein